MFKIKKKQNSRTLARCLDKLNPDYDFAVVDDELARFDNIRSGPEYSEDYERPATPFASSSVILGDRLKFENYSQVP